MAEAFYQVPFANQEGRSAVAQNSRERLINMFCEVESSGRLRLNRRQRACLALIEPLAGEKRCIERGNDGTHYLVVGSKFFSFDGASLTECGTLDTNSGPVTMVFDDNGDVALSDGTTLYHWTGAVFSKPVTPSAVGTLTFINGFAVYSEPGSGRFWWSAVNDMQSWDGLDFATAEGKPDNLVRVWSDHRELWLVGEQTIEIWALSGGLDSPFSFTASMQRGSGAALSVVSEDNSVFWLGDDWVMWRADGYRPVRVSTHSIERLVEAVPLPARRDCRAFSYTDQGHKFVTLVWPGYLAVQYNVATGFWNVAKTFERDDWDVLGSQYTNADYVLSGAGISELRRGINTDNGEVVERGGVSAPISEGARRVIVRAFFLDCEVGRASIGIDPKARIRIAHDGETFGNERWRSAGKTGFYTRRITWRNLGIGRRMTVEIMVTDDFEFSILGSDATVDVL